MSKTSTSKTQKPSRKKLPNITSYVVDTNVIIDDPDFRDKLTGRIIIPTTVLRELDNMKCGGSENAKNIRKFVRLLSNNVHNFAFHISHHYEGENDDQIIQTAAKEKATLVTNDLLMGLMAKASGIPVKKHEVSKSFIEQKYYGLINTKKYEEGDEILNKVPLYPNQYIVKQDGLYRIAENEKLERLGKDRSIWGVSHKNVAQRCAIDALLNDNIKLITVSGKAGTGKTLLAIVAGLEKVANEKKYGQLLISRPIVPMGNDLGFLPGDMKEKLAPWMQPIFDNIDFVFSHKNDSARDVWKRLESEGLLKLEALTYIRGRSISNAYIVIDEAQNLTKHEAKTIVSRVGENTKIILTGDIHQIDNPKLNPVNNGLSYIAEKFKNQSIAAHISLTRCERSALADIASDIL